MLPSGGHRRRVNQTQTQFGLQSQPSLSSHHHHQQQQPMDSMNMLLSPSSGRGNEEDEFPKRDERYPQWENQETKEFVRMRAELEHEFAASKRNKPLWEVVSAKMREKGYYRTPDQCKSKWKNLINKYKEMEGTRVDFSNQFPFLEELNEFFSVQEKQMFLNSEPGSSKLGKRERATSGEQSSEEIYDGGNKIERDEDWVGTGSTVQKRKAKKEKHHQTTAPEKSFNQPNMPANNNTTNALNGIAEMLQGFFQQQQKIDMLWMESMDKHAQERALFEQEWRQSMEKLERERLMMEKSWKEREEQRRSREENRAERRDALMTALLNRLVHD
ncbi:hypothetical protein LIER_18258 [Lithospermum erythrorhizon]|uniref:Myb-like domain-containing protein n=1 Tax=Lithospermum erythrorhizon TaxID=34254 RepID=A0AAV3QEB1_LITER